MNDGDEPRLPMVRPSVAVDDRLLGRLEAVLRSGQLSNGGPALERLEGALAEWLGRDDVLCVSSGAAALTLALRGALPEGGGGRALLPAFTYAATLNAVEQAGLEPVFCDVDAATWTLDTRAVAQAFEAGPVRAVIAVNSYGVPPDMESLGSRCEANGAALVYDNCHGLGTRPLPPVWQSFSLHATKLLPAAEGGAVLGPDLAAVRRLSCHGLAEDLLDSQSGYNFKLDELRATVAQHGLERLDEVIERRQRYVRQIRDALQRRADRFVVQRVPPGAAVVWQNLAVRCTRGTEWAVAHFGAHGIEARRYFYPPLHRLRRLAPQPALANTELLEGELVCLPLHDEMSAAALARIEAAVAAA